MTMNADPTIEIYARLSIASGKENDLEESASTCIEQVRATEPGTLRYDWFVDRQTLQGVAMDVYANRDAMMFHMQNVHQLFPPILANASLAMSFLGQPGDDIMQMTKGFAPRQYDFLAGLDSGSAASRFTPNSGDTESGHVEIMSEFQVNPDKWQRFCELALEHVDVVSRKDSATLRYDWFIDEANHRCIAMDTYRDAAGLFAHMGNCRDIHHEFRDLSDMTAVFLGKLPQEVSAAVAKYDPLVLPFFKGLGGHSAGGFD